MKFVKREKTTINRKSNFFTNWICYWQIRFCTYYAFSLNQISDICELWKYWPLEDGFRSISQKFCRASILWGVDQKTSTFLVDISFESGLQNILLSNLLLFSCACIKLIYNTSHKLWDQPPSPHDQCCLQISEIASWHKLQSCYSPNMLQHWVGGRGLIYFCKEDHSRIFKKFPRNWPGLNNLCEIL